MLDYTLINCFLISILILPSMQQLTWAACYCSALPPICPFYLQLYFYDINQRRAIEVDCKVSLLLVEVAPSLAEYLLRVKR